MQRPNSETVPAVAGINPTRMRPAVDLPEPDSPTSPSVSPAMTSKLTSSNAFSGETPPAWLTMNVFLRPRASTIAGSAIGGASKKNARRAADAMQLSCRLERRPRPQRAVLYTVAHLREDAPPCIFPAADGPAREH